MKRRFVIAAVFTALHLSLNAILDKPPQPEPLPDLLTEQEIAERQQQKEAVTETAKLYLKAQNLTGFGNIDPEKVEKLTSN